MEVVEVAESGTLNNGEGSGHDPAGGVVWDDDARACLHDDAREEWSHVLERCDRLPPDLRDAATTLAESLFAVSRLTDADVSPWHWRLCHGAMRPTARESARAWRAVGEELRANRLWRPTRVAVGIARTAAWAVRSYHAWISRVRPPIFSVSNFADTLCEHLELPDEPHYLRSLAESVARDMRRVARNRVRIGYVTPGESSANHCRVQVRSEARGRTMPAIATVDGVDVEVDGKHRWAFLRALAKMVAAAEAGRDGITLHELGPDQGAVSSVRKCSGLWKAIISTPGDRDQRIRPGLYFIQSA